MRLTLVIFSTLIVTSCQQHTVDRVESPERGSLLTSEQAEFLKQIEIDCSIGPYFLDIDQRGEVVFKVPPNFRVKPPSNEQSNCVQKLVEEKLHIEVAP